MTLDRQSAMVALVKEALSAHGCSCCRDRKRYTEARLSLAKMIGVTPAEFGIEKCWACEGTGTEPDSDDSEVCCVCEGTGWD